MYASYERATVACEIWARPAVNGITNVVASPAVLLDGLFVTPLQPYADPDQMAPLDSYRDKLVGYIFAVDDADWTALQTVDEGMVLVLTATSAEWQIVKADFWQRSFPDFQQRHRHVELIVEKVKVTS